ncbi:GNAT family N-acetyltransferase [Mesorhizobium sp. M0115]|uniref:GNAT family N-acetyltransferase n=1 Tax=unclassified Mesorhizobium TaxID=325217 RepID=UPI0033368C1A
MITIFDASLSDVPSLAELQAGAAFNRWISSPPPVAELRTEIKGKLVDMAAGRGRYIVARWAGKPAGYGAAYLTRCQRRAHVEVGVDPDHFRKGIGTAIVDALIAYKRTVSLERLEAVVDVRNKACLTLLRLRGFREVETAPRPVSLRWCKTPETRSRPARMVPGAAWLDFSPNS